MSAYIQLKQCLLDIATSFHNSSCTISEVMAVQIKQSPNQAQPERWRIEENTIKVDQLNKKWTKSKKKIGQERKGMK
ncbi:unnamed protein product [Callosobruchus maculatus]|uniref:Uncharacterized protein n=1 Tax=Callosobruchus maculatus TaxID=64391 RepID=A0A653CC97_CALMS|nr:unnamed protein product [Callosobruchus maculatus]